MKISFVQIKDWVVSLLISTFLRKYYAYDRVDLEVEDFEAEGLILDIGGGGEGVIGRLKSQQVVAIDIHKGELDDILNGPHKVIMDARHLAFPINCFSTATAFFSMMYLKTREDQQQVFSQTWQVLKPGGMLRVWDIDLYQRPDTHKEFYLARLRYRVAGFRKETGYGAIFPPEPRGEAYYRQLASAAGFHPKSTERVSHLMYLEFTKPENTEIRL